VPSPQNDKSVREENRRRDDKSVREKNRDAMRPGFEVDIKTALVQ